MGEILKKVQEVNTQFKMLQSIIGKKDLQSNVDRLEKLIFILAEEIDNKKLWNRINLRIFFIFNSDRQDNYEKN